MQYYCIIRFENLSKRNVTWAMQYKKMPKKECLQQCEKISHKIPSIEFINDNKLASIEQAKIYYHNLLTV